ncbi:MAG: iron chelate uptake ABC transporter family permease subunit [Deltaproteobacteria bacterium]|nr:iron chelate uptake ABC transporter family permease subunit [Deltaproteobacteria bacterium]
MNVSVPTLSLALKSTVVHQRRWPLVVCVVLLFCSMTLASSLGAVTLPLDTTARLLAKGIAGLPIDGEERAQAAIIYLIRFPRVLAAALVGAALALSGVVMQGLFRNPLADAGIIGVLSGGALGGVIVISMGLAATSFIAVPCATFAGALCTAFAVYFFTTRKGRTPLTTLLLVGIAVNSVLASLTSLILSLSPDYEISRQMYFWLMGGLDGRSWMHVQIVLPFLLVGFLPIQFLSRDLNVLLLGEETAMTLGLNVELVRRLLLALSALLAGAAVAVSGTVSFVGLVIPHVMRLIVGPDHRLLLPAAALGGGIFLVWCDLLSRTLAPTEELRLGIITAFVGGPFFLYLLLREEKRQQRRL